MRKKAARLVDQAAFGGADVDGLKGVFPVHLIIDLCFVVAFAAIAVWRFDWEE